MILSAGLSERSARAEILAAGHCSVSTTFSDLERYLDASIGGALEQYGIGRDPESLIYFDGVQVELVEEGELPGTDDDQLRLTIIIGTVIGTHHVSVEFRFRQVPPYGSGVCRYGTVDNYSYTIIGGPFTVCPPNWSDPTDCHVVPDGRSFLVQGLVSDDLLFLADNQQPHPGDDGAFTTNCHRVFWESCTELSRWVGEWPLQCNVPDPHQAAVILCEHKNITSHEIRTDSSGYPGLFVDRISHDFGVLVDIAVPGMNQTIYQYMERSGFADLWDFTENPDDPDGSIVNFESKCALQDLLNDAMDPVLREPAFKLGNEPISVASLLLIGGGAVIDGEAERIHLGLPNLSAAHDVPRNASGDGLPGYANQCTARTDVREDLRNALDNFQESYPGADHGRFIGLAAIQEAAMKNLDLVKMAHHFLESVPIAKSLDLRVFCNHGFNCQDHGGDSDQDGFCDEGPYRDLCPDLPTSANCDVDGDGVGDGTVHLMGHPAAPGKQAVSPACFDLVGNLENLFEEYTAAGEETRQRLRNFACGGCDNCQNQINTDKWRPLARDPANPEIVPPPINLADLPEAFRLEEMGTLDQVRTGTMQPDFDHDWVGDTCDPDKDGDRFANDFDCGELNPYLGVDLDQDGWCEIRTDRPTSVGNGFPYSDCLDWCERTDRQYRLEDPGDPLSPWGRPYIDVSECKEQCSRGKNPIGDNCAPPANGYDQWCGVVLNYCLFGDLTSTALASCTEERKEYCAMQYGNSDQLDSNGDGLGDKCSTGTTVPEIVSSVRVWPFFHGPSFQFGCNKVGESARVTMRAFGGDALWNNGDPVYETVTRTAFEVGVCACDHDPETTLISDEGPEWLEECWTTKCPNNNDPDSPGEEDLLTRFKYWNPVSDPAYAAAHPIGCSGNTCFRDQARIAQAEVASLVYGRRQDFTRDPATNALDLDWQWRDSREVWWTLTAAGATLDNYIHLPFYDYDAGYFPPHRTPLRISHARATWPRFGLTQDEPIIVRDYATEVAYGKATLLDEGQGQCFGDVYLGPPFVLDLIPGMVDLWPKGEAWLGGLSELPGVASRPVSAWLLGRSAATGELLLYRHAAEAFNLDAAQRIVGTGLDPAARVSSAIAALDGAVWGLEAGRRHQALAVYQQPRFSLPDEISHGGTNVPGRLLLGRLSEGEEVTLEAVQTISGQAPPSLWGGQVLLHPRAPTAVLIGRIGSGAGAWALARGSLVTGDWSSARRLDLPATESLLAARFDPVRHRILLVTVSHTGGVTSAPEETLRVTWLDPTTLSMTPAAPDAPADLPRARATVAYDARTRTLWIAGGERDGAFLDDVWKLDLGRRTWTPVAQMPVALASPVIHWDPAPQVLWVGAVRTDVAGFDLFAYDATAGTWTEHAAPVVPAEPSWPVEATYWPGRPAVYPYPVSESTALPGAVVLGRLSTAEAGLGVELRSGSGEVLAVSEVDPTTGDDRVAGLCPAGGACALVVRPDPGMASAAAPYTLDAHPAALVEAGRLPGPTLARSLVLRGDRLHLVGPLGIRTLSAFTLDDLGWLVLPGLLGSQAGASCGGYLCVVRPGPWGFMVVDPSRTGPEAVLGRAHLGLQAQDLAVWGRRAYVAQGTAGVALVDLGNPAAPRVVGTLATGGRAVSVAVREGLLAVGLADGTVALYDVTGAPALRATVAAGFRVGQVRFVAGQVFVLDHQERRAAVVSVADPAQPVRVGQFEDQAAALTLGVWRGTRLLALDGIHLRQWQAQ